MAQITRSNKWRNSISIKNQFQDETTPELITQLCSSLVKQLNKIKAREENGNLTDDGIYYVVDELDRIIDNFDFLCKINDGTISKNDFHLYEYAPHKLEEWFNGYMDELYNLAGERVITKDNVLEKFIWIG